jgi:hypothetical protein
MTVLQYICSNNKKLQFKRSVEQRVNIMALPQIMASWLITLCSLTTVFKIINCMVFGHRRMFLNLYKVINNE